VPEQAYIRAIPSQLMGMINYQSVGSQHACGQPGDDRQPGHEGHRPGALPEVSLDVGYAQYQTASTGRLNYESTGLVSLLPLIEA